MTEAPEAVSYTPRRVRPLGRLQIDDWRVKLHGLGATDGELEPAAREGARKAATEALPRPGIGGGRYGVGFVIAHRSTNAYSYVVGWWSYGCLLSTAAYSARFSDPADIARCPARQAGCVWELAVIDHERRAWTRTMLRAGADGDLDGYLDTVLSGKV
ncbi:hypothetical protein [Catenulispora pinisilvae]|uniref:hypothetical protein n=1 Tax=Catenulispora pinisilvae TaxID=2705253 RepID=UPI00189157D5|nr:hypothetical protein [Catenulispora pinisilvae]